MKKNMMRKNLRQSIKKSMGRYIAIAAIIALGAGLFCGLRVTKKDMIATVQKYTDEQNMFDLQVMNTYGWTDDDVFALSQTPGIESAEGSISLDALLSFENGDDTAYKLISIPEMVNKIGLDAGRLPQTGDEILGDSFFMDKSVIGKTVYVSSANEDTVLDGLAYDSYTIVGLVNTPMYLNMQRGSTSIGNGSLATYFYLPRDGFDMDVYTQINLTLVGNYDVYTDEYDDAMDALVDPLEVAAKPLANQRLLDVKTEAEEAYADGLKEYLDGMEEFRKGKAEAEEALADAEQEILDGEKEIETNRKLLEDGEKQIEDAEKTLSETKATISQSRTDLAAARMEAYEQIAAGYDELFKNYKEVTNGLNQIESGLPQLESGIAQIEAGLTQLETGLSTIDLMLPILDLSIDGAQKALDQVKQLPNMEDYQEKLDEAQAKLDELTAQKEEYALQREELVKTQTELETQLEELNAQKAELEATKATLEAALDTIEIGFKEAENGQTQADNQFAAAEAQLDAAELQIEEGKLQLEEKKLEIAEGLIALEDAEKQLAEGKAEFETEKEKVLKELADAEAELEDAMLQLSDARQTIDELEDPDVFVLTRNTNLGYVVFESDSDIVAGVAEIFPLFFLAVAALVCITTMTRMVDEERTQIGTLKALGYGNFSIMWKYLAYAGSSALLGCSIGIALGCIIFPQIIWFAYCIMYNFSDQLVLSYDLPTIVTIVLSYTALTELVTWYCCKQSLKEVPAELIRPKAPTAGKKIFLEYLGFWKNLKFLDKVALRNIFRYRQRMAMMLMGIGGCTALLVTGFGLRDSVVDLTTYQFENVTLYDIGVTFSDPMTEENQDAFRKEFRGMADSVLFCEQGGVDIEFEDSVKNVNFLAVDRPLEGYIDLHSGSEKLANPGLNECILSIGSAEAMGIEVGDQVLLRNADMEEMTLTVSGIFDNHVFNYAIVAGQTMRQQWDRSPELTSAFVVNGQNQDVHELGAAIAGFKNVISVSVNADTAEQVGSMMSALDAVVALVVICAGLLASIVLYNLTNINIKERVREIATIKVLGFNAAETGAYVFKENLTLTVMGTLLGLVGGKFLHAVVMSYVRIDMVWFANQIKPLSYIFAAVLTLLAALIVDFVMYFQLDKINMAEALKSVE